MMNEIESFHGIHLCVACMCLWVFACVGEHGCAKEWRPKIEIGFRVWSFEAESLTCPRDFLVSDSWALNLQASYVLEEL